MYLTDIRLVFVVDKPQQFFTSFGLPIYFIVFSFNCTFKNVLLYLFYNIFTDIPLVLIKNEKFNQPIFGCNNLTGECMSVSFILYCILLLLFVVFVVVVVIVAVVVVVAAVIAVAVAFPPFYFAFTL